MSGQNRQWLPQHEQSPRKQMRRVGVEIELAGLEPEVMMEVLQQHFGGKPHEHTLFEYSLQETRFGKFVVELDASYLKELGQKQQAEKGDEPDDLLDTLQREVLTRAAEAFVPWEIVTPPLPMSQLQDLNAAIKDLRERGALGTRHALQYAFGLHLNPELPSHEPDIILNYLRAYFCLYDWIEENERIDLTRRITPYIRHFDKEYIMLCLDPDYTPDLDTLIDDYLEHNPTRNRSLDMLPLFTFLDEDRVRNVVEDPRVKARPTFHYRLPNCEIDRDDWDLWQAWG
ncbi:MAG: amidoligase family protein, partial [Oleiphilaceae bacterium]|nr:amidoligase family protein [Oleiphilaceae bacterium]